MTLFPNTTIWPNGLFRLIALLSSIGLVIFFGVKANLDPGIIVAIVLPLATALGQSLPAIEKTKPAPSIPPAVVQAVVTEAVKLAASMMAPPPPKEDPAVVVVPPLPPVPVIETPAEEPKS